MRLLLALAALTASTPSAAVLGLEIQDTQPGLRLALGVDVFRAPGSVIGIGRYGGNWGVSLGVWAYNSPDVGPEQPNAFIGADYMITSGKWRGGIGLVLIDQVNNMNGTYLNLSLTLAYDFGQRYFVEYRHVSHAKDLGVRTDAANASWNFVSLGLLF